MRLVLLSCVIRAFGLVVLLTGAIEGFALSSPSGPLLFPNLPQKLAVGIWKLMFEYVPSLWRFLFAISPYPHLTQPLPWATWLIWIGWSSGFILLGFSAMKMAEKLRQNADNAATALNNQAAIVVQMEQLFSQAAASANVGIIGQGNNVQIAQSVTTITDELHKSDKEKWYRLPGGIVLLSVIGKVITHFLGV